MMLYTKFPMTRHFKAAIIAHSIPKNSVNAEGPRGGPGAVAWVHFDFGGGSGSVISGIGTSKSGFCVSWHKKN